MWKSLWNVPFVYSCSWGDFILKTVWADNIIRLFPPANWCDKGLSRKNSRHDVKFRQTVHIDFLLSWLRKYPIHSTLLNMLARCSVQTLVCLQSLCWDHCLLSHKVFLSIPWGLFLYLGDHYQHAKSWHPQFIFHSYSWSRAFVRRSFVLLFMFIYSSHTLCHASTYHLICPLDPEDNECNINLL